MRATNREGQVWAPAGGHAFLVLSSEDAVDRRFVAKEHVILNLWTGEIFEGFEAASWEGCDWAVGARVL